MAVKWAARRRAISSSSPSPILFFVLLVFLDMCCARRQGKTNYGIPPLASCHPKGFIGGILYNAGMQRMCVRGSQLGLKIHSWKKTTTTTAAATWWCFNTEHFMDDLAAVMRQPDTVRWSRLFTQKLPESIYLPDVYSQRVYLLHGSNKSFICQQIKAV